MAAPSRSISIALPVFNGEAHLAEALESVAAQTKQPTQILVFDNCSTDRSRDIAARFIPDGDVRQAPHNLGAAANFNRAVLESAGEFFAWLADDDRLLPRHLETCVNALQQSPDAPACLPAIRFIDQDGRPLKEQSDVALSSTDPHIRLRSFLRRPRWTEVYCLYRRVHLVESPMFRDEFGADVLLTWWFLIRHPLVVVDEPLLEYRVYPTKTPGEMAESLRPGSQSVQLRKARLWRRLWEETRAPDIVDSPAAGAARRELISCLWHRDWVGHFYEDVRYCTIALIRSHRSTVLRSSTLSGVVVAAKGRRARQRTTHSWR